MSSMSNVSLRMYEMKKPPGKARVAAASKYIVAKGWDLKAFTNLGNAYLVAFVDEAKQNDLFELMGL